MSQSDSFPLSARLACRVCGQLLSKSVERLSGVTLGMEDEEPAIPPGTYAHSNDVLEDGDEFWGLGKDEIVIGLVDLVDVEACGNRVGCCGPAGDGPNLQCLQGHVVGTEVGDCYQPHFVHLPLTCVELVEE